MVQLRYLLANPISFAILHVKLINKSVLGISESFNTTSRLIAGTPYPKGSMKTKVRTLPSTNFRRCRLQSSFVKSASDPQQNRLSNLYVLKSALYFSVVASVLPRVIPQPGHFISSGTLLSLVLPKDADNSLLLWISF